MSMMWWSAVGIGVFGIIVVGLWYAKARDRRRPDPFAVMQTPVKKYEGYDYAKAIAAKWQSLPPGSEARKAIEAGRRPKSERVVRLVKDR